jgi:AcrR family transcriptional regulator
LIECGKLIHSEVVVNTPRKKLDLNPIYLEVSKLLLFKNPEQISFSLVSQRTKVPRTTLYYYFDSKIESLLTESIRYTMKDFMQLWSSEPMIEITPATTWQEIQKIKFQKVVELISKSPEAIRLYLRYCDHPSFLGDEVRYIEKLYLATGAKDWDRLHSKPLEPRLQSLLAQIKVGILWGLAGRENHWKGQEEKLVETCVKLFSLFEML